jgi:dopamine beta-monooxygenase
MWANLLLCVLLTALYLTAHAYPTNRKKIPNGYSVPNPCNLSTIWPGVGHENVYGSGPRNPFGRDFEANGQVWDKTVCEKDSDGDGRTNGEELGDPNCIWTVGSNISSDNITITHPGVCEPLDSPVCAVKNTWLTNCRPRKLNCPAINEPGVLNYTLRFPVTPIPTKETTYICHSLALPWESVADMIAFEPIIDNAVILHHMMVLATNEEPKGQSINQSISRSINQSVFRLLEALTDTDAI